MKAVRLQQSDRSPMGSGITSIGNLLPFWFGSGKMEIPMTKQSGQAIQINSGPLTPHSPISSPSPINRQGPIETPKKSETAR